MSVLNEVDSRPNAVATGREGTSPQSPGPRQRIRRVPRRKVAIISPLPASLGADPASGVGQYLVEILERVSDRFDVTVLADADTPLRTIGDARVIPTWSPDSRCVPQVIRALSSLRPDVIHLQHEFNLFGGLLPTALLTGAISAGRAVGRPPVVTIHGVVDKSAVTPACLAVNELPASPSAARASLSLAYRSIAKASAKVIVHHTHFKRILTDSFNVDPDKVNVIPFGSDVLPHRARLVARGTGSPRVLIFGFLTGYKSPELAVELAEEALIPNAHFRFCVGINPRSSSPEHLRRYDHLSARVHKLGSRATWSGYAPDHELPEIFGSSDIVILPYTECLSGSAVAALAHAHGVAVCHSRELRPLFGQSSAEFELTTASLARAITATHGSTPADSCGGISWTDTAELNELTWADVVDGR
jgi:glycosyltransferase involved in cell wall biosynthesis